jgi:hypothetical protein
MKTTNYMRMEAEDILPILRPIGKSRPPNETLTREIHQIRERLGLKKAKPRAESDLKCPPEYRACKNMNIHFHEVKYDRSLFGINETVYSFTVNYCMRKHRLDKTLDQFMQLHVAMGSDQLQIPALPEMPTNWLGINQLTDAEYGEQLAQYIMQNHLALSDAGLFSPRMFKFLCIDFERVQSEEEGAIMALLDTQIPISKACYYMLEEKWLAKWRRFAMGRGPRRYLPPGRVDNDWLMDQIRNPGRHMIRVAEHYRCVNYNVWAFYTMVHTGGPCIPRKDQNVYSDVGMSYLQAVLLVQTRMRVYLARKQKRFLYMERFSRTFVARGILAGEMMELNKSIVHKSIQAERRKRLDSKVRQAVVLTQRLWRKKAKSVPEENLARSQADQEIFRRGAAMGAEAAVSSDLGIVVRVVHPVVNIGSTSTYFVTVEEDQYMGRVPFEIQKVPWSEEAIIPLNPSSPHLDHLTYVPGSKILSVNDLPTASMTYTELKAKISTVPWPLRFELMRPVTPEKMMTWKKLMIIQDDGLLYSAFKLFLTNQMELIRHNPEDGIIVPKKPWLTRIVLSDTHVYYRRKTDTKKSESNHWHNFSLFQIKYVCSSDEIDGLSKRINKEACFSITTNEKQYVFEVPTKQQLDLLLLKEENKRYKNRRPAELTSGGGDDDSYNTSTLEHLRTVTRTKYTPKNLQDQKHEAAKKGTIIVKCLKQLVDELRRHQTFVDADGVPTMRKAAKTSLRKIL